MPLTISTTVTLNNGVQMPLFGLGVFRTTAGETTRRAVAYALQIGYRLVDTASAYGNEEDVGTGIAESGIDRREVFLITKAWVDELGVTETREACARSLQRLSTDYLDLYLIHWPAPERWLDAWKTMLALREEGMCRAVGVSNFNIRQLGELLAATGIAPAVDQVEFSPFTFRKNLLEYCRGKGIRLQSYAPLTRGAKLDHPTVRAIADAHDKSPAQILIRWTLQHEVAVIPKSANPVHIRENADVFDFALTPQEMAALDALNEDFSVVNPNWRMQFE
ncbi:MAG: aldo/keto reductase [Armatimonadota bacterium]